VIDLAAASPGANEVVTGVLAFLLVAGMGLALFFLLRSMNKQLRKVVSGPRWRQEARQAAHAEGQPRPADVQGQPRSAAGQGRPEHPANGEPGREQDGS
jgi:hypothetical protein